MFDGSNAEGGFQINQRFDPVGLILGGRPFQNMGTFQIDSTSLALELSDNADGYVIADAARFVRVGDLPGAVAAGNDGELLAAAASNASALDGEPRLRVESISGTPSASESRSDDRAVDLAGQIQVDEVNTSTGRRHSTLLDELIDEMSRETADEFAWRDLADEVFARLGH
jgi:hypothetical protein